MRLSSHQHTRPVNCLLAKANHQKTDITLTLHPSRHTRYLVPGMFCFVCHFSGGGTSLFIFFFLVSYVFPLCQRILIAICMSYLSYSVRWHAIALSTLLTALPVHRNISVSWFCDHRACISPGGRIGTDTGCTGCRRVERTI